MTGRQIAELVPGLLFVLGGILLYIRRGREDPRHGSQGAVLLLIVGAIVLIHGLGLLDYRPSRTELGR